MLLAVHRFGSFAWQTASIAGHAEEETDMAAIAAMSRAEGLMRTVVDVGDSLR